MTTGRSLSAPWPSDAGPRMTLWLTHVMLLQTLQGCGCIPAAKRAAARYAFHQETSHFIENRNLQERAHGIAAGCGRPLIDSHFPFEEAAETVQRLPHVHVDVLSQAVVRPDRLLLRGERISGPGRIVAVARAPPTLGFARWPKHAPPPWSSTTWTSWPAIRHAEPIVRALLDRAIRRLHMLCATLLYKSYPRLTHPPLSLNADELLGAVTERLLKAMHEVHPRTVRQFFALANRHIRWELNDVARRLDEQPAAVGLRDELVPAPASSGSVLTPDGLRMLQAIDALPMDERETFDLVRIQGLTLSETAKILGVTIRTVQRRLARGLMLLTEQLDDLRPSGASPNS